MAVRVHELAREFGVESKVVLNTLKDMGEYVKSASSTVEAPVVRRLTEEHGDALRAQGAKKGGGKAAAKKAAPAKADAPAEEVPAAEAPAPTAKPTGPTPGPRVPRSPSLSRLPRHPSRHQLPLPRRPLLPSRARPRARARPPQVEHAPATTRSRRRRACSAHRVRPLHAKVALRRHPAYPACPAPTRR